MKLVELPKFEFVNNLQILMANGKNYVAAISHGGGKNEQNGIELFECSLRLFELHKDSITDPVIEWTIYVPSFGEMDFCINEGKLYGIFLANTNHAAYLASYKMTDDFGLESLPDELIPYSMPGNILGDIFLEMENGWSTISDFLPPEEWLFYPSISIEKGIAKLLFVTCDAKALLCEYDFAKGKFESKVILQNAIAPKIRHIWGRQIITYQKARPGWQVYFSNPMYSNQGIQIELPLMMGQIDGEGVISKERQLILAKDYGLVSKEDILCIAAIVEKEDKPVLAVFDLEEINGKILEKDSGVLISQPTFMICGGDYNSNYVAMLQRSEHDKIRVAII